MMITIHHHLNKNNNTSNNNNKKKKKKKKTNTRASQWSVPLQVINLKNNRILYVDTSYKTYNQLKCTDMKYEKNMAKKDRFQMQV